MSDESSDNDLAWWMPPDRPDPAEHEDIIELGPVDSTRPIGPMSLRTPSRRPYLLAGVAVAALLGGAGAALAATNSGTPAATPSAVTATPVPTPSAGRPGTHGGFRHFGARFGPLGLGPFGMVHGQFVVAKPGGGYQTVDVQNGQVTAVSTTSITLKSSDGFTKTYVVTSSTMVDAQRDGIGSVKAGNKASVLAVVSGSTATANSIADMTLLQQNQRVFGNGQGSGAGGAQSG
jgi:hypothetical protein